MEFVIDLILMIIFAVVVITAYKKGLLRSLADSFGFIISVFSASKVAEYTHMWIYENFFKERIIESVRQEIASSEAVTQIKISFLDIKDVLSGFSSIVGFDTENLSKQISEIDLSAENAAVLLTETTIQPILTVIIKCTVFLILSIVFIAILSLLSRFLTRVINKTPLSAVNKFFGAVFGIFKGFVTVALLMVLFVLLASLIENDGFDTMVESSRIFELLNTKSNIFKIN